MITVSNTHQKIPSLFTDLATTLSGDIDCSPQTLFLYSQDASPYQVLPQAVFYPKNTTDIKHILSFAREYKLPVAARGKGASSSGGSLTEGLVIDISRYFDQIRGVNMVDNIVTVDAGVTIQSLLNRIHAWHFDIPIFSLGEEGTVGGCSAAKNMHGGSFLYGSVQDWVESITVVLDNGEEHILQEGVTPTGRLLGIYQELFPLLQENTPHIRAAKPSLHGDGTGYSLWSPSVGPRQLINQILGSEGTLAIITSVTFRMTKHKPHSQTTCVPITDKKLIPTLLDIAEHHHADHIFFCDQAFMQLSARYHKDLLPEYKDITSLLFVTHRHTDKEKLHHLVTTYHKALPVEGATTLKESTRIDAVASDSFLYSLLTSYSNGMLLPYSACTGSIIPRREIPSFLEQLEDSLDNLSRVYVITGNIASGHLAPIMLFDPYGRTHEDEVLRFTKVVFSLVKKYHGGISAHSGEGIAKTPYLSYVFGEHILQLFEKIKHVWDPLGILNPRKKLSLTTSYLAQHLKRPKLDH